MAYNSEDDENDTDEYRRQQMKALQDGADEPSEDGLGAPPQQSAPPVITTPPPSLAPPPAKPPAIPGGDAGTTPPKPPSEPSPPKPAAAPPSGSDPSSVKNWVVETAKKLGRNDIAQNPDYWVQVISEHGPNVDTGYWSGRMQSANMGGGGTSAFASMAPNYLGGAGPGNFGPVGGTSQVSPYMTSDTLQQILAELAASQTGEQSPLGRRLQMQQLQNVQQQES